LKFDSLPDVIRGVSTPYEVGDFLFLKNPADPGPLDESSLCETTVQTCLFKRKTSPGLGRIANLRTSSAQPRSTNESVPNVMWAIEVFLRHSRDSNESTEELMNKGLVIQP
jgi:hypothetical protein